VKSYLSFFSIVAVLVTMVFYSSEASAQLPPVDQTFDTSKPAKLDIVEGLGRYRVRETLTGVTFESDAVGNTAGITGSLTILPDGSIGSGSKVTVDLTTLKSDQAFRDMYLGMVTLETKNFPTLDFTPKQINGLDGPLPSSDVPEPIGFTMVGDVTLKGVTKETTWDVVGILNGSTVSGRATTTLLFSDFALTKPAIPFLASVADEIQLEIEFTSKRSEM
jgi:polyisoprenoid-binding protein YceI